MLLDGIQQIAVDLSLSPCLYGYIVIVLAVLEGGVHTQYGFHHFWGFSVVFPPLTLQQVAFCAGRPALKQCIPRPGALAAAVGRFELNQPVIILSDFGGKRFTYRPSQRVVLLRFTGKVQNVDVGFLVYQSAGKVVLMPSGLNQYHLGAGRETGSERGYPFCVDSLSIGFAVGFHLVLDGVVYNH